jgi:hypothetical protein
MPGVAAASDGVSKMMVSPHALLWLWLKRFIPQAGNGIRLMLVPAPSVSLVRNPEVRKFPLDPRVKPRYFRHQAR